MKAQQGQQGSSEEGMGGGGGGEDGLDGSQCVVVVVVSWDGRVLGLGEERLGGRRTTAVLTAGITGGT